MRANAIVRFWDSSVGKKMVMAVTGVIGVLFTIGHMAGNLLVFQGAAKFDAYAHFLQSLGGLLWVARGTLLAAVALHVVAAYQLTMRNRAARPVGYATREPQVSTLASRTLRWGGVLLLGFIVFHILHFTLGTVHPDFDRERAFRNVVIGFQQPLASLFYVAAMGALALHLFHGVWSSTRTLGVAPTTPMPLRRRVALALAIAVPLGFASIPLAVLLGLVK
ncbi:MAG: succinate dehydrogenase cytochrome b subunit [Gemmatimonadales bacterium]|nr:succinate dehydrogenase cytochrome b subunit [Gemmatimonadales bacterium]